MNKREQFDSITGLRAIACLCIVCYHFFCLYIDDAGLGREQLPWYPQSAFFFEYAKNAAELFFLLSGFLTAWHTRSRIDGLAFGTYGKRKYRKLFGASVVVNLWALVNLRLMDQAGLGAAAVTPLRFLLSVLMINTGWFTSYAQTQLPVAGTMWYVDILLLCTLLYDAVCRIGKNRGVYLALCAGMVFLGWICLDRTPNLPFLWALDGRGYVPFFLGALLSEFQRNAGDRQRTVVTRLWFGFAAAFFLFHSAVGFERVFGSFGTLRYVRYFEFIAAPGILLAALNLTPVRTVLSWKPLVWLGGLSAAVYYVHNNVMQDYLILNELTGSKFNLLTPVSFLLIVLSMIPWAMLYRALEETAVRRKRAAVRTCRQHSDVSKGEEKH